jgi:3-(3-hydroxy-phenyl)propionate hydroxylase
MNNAKLPVIIAGAGPVGMVAAADLVRQNIPVLVLEKSETLSSESRASTFHPPTPGHARRSRFRQRVD